MTKPQLFLRSEVQALMSTTDLPVPVPRSDTVRAFKVRPPPHERGEARE